MTIKKKKIKKRGDTMKTNENKTVAEDLNALPAITKRPPRTPESLAYIKAVIAEYAEVEVINP